MDIVSTKPWPLDALSNFYPHAFEFDAIDCASMEGLLNAFKFEDVKDQERCCAMEGIIAKRFGRGRNRIWQAQQTLWWDGDAYDRHGKPYQRLLDRAFATLAHVPAFAEALLATGTAPLTHRMGCPDPRLTVLTEEEFCSRLMVLRNLLRRES